MRPHVIRFAFSSVACLLVFTFTLPISGTSGSTINTLNVPVIHLSSIQGYNAEISDYHFDEQQNFCFTLTNTSPLPINAIGGDLGSEAFVSIASQTDNGALQFHVEASQFDHTLNGVPMSFVLFSVGGLAPGASTTICLTGLGGSADFIAHHLFVTFVPAVNLGCGDLSASFPFELALVQFTHSTSTRQCIVITNPTSQVVTGVGLRLGDLNGPFDLVSVTPSRQPFNQHLRISLNPGDADDVGSIPLNLALLSGGQFLHGPTNGGVQPGEASSEFCIDGNFEGLTTQELLQRTYVRMNDVTRQCMDVCCPVGQGQTGILAGEPR